MKTNKRFLKYLQNLTWKLPIWMLMSYSETHWVICSHVKLESIPWTLQIQSYSESCKNHVSNVSLGAWSKPEFFSLIMWSCVLQNGPSFFQAPQGLAKWVAPVLVWALLRRTGCAPRPVPTLLPASQAAVFKDNLRPSVPHRPCSKCVEETLEGGSS